MLATDIADYLVGKGLTFRNAHQIVGKLVSYAAKQGKGLGQLTIDEYRRLSPEFDHEVFAITVEKSLAARKSYGGTAPPLVEKALIKARERLA